MIISYDLTTLPPVRTENETNMLLVMLCRANISQHVIG
jgi:hypothetical protein